MTDLALSLVAIFVAITGLLWQHFGIISKLQQRVTKNEAKLAPLDCVDINSRLAKIEAQLESADLSKMSSRIESIETKIELFWEVVREKVIGIIHSPHTPETDILLDKLRDKTISPEEAKELEIMLECALRENKDNGKSMAYIMVITLLRRMSVA